MAELMHADAMSPVSDEFGKLYLDHPVRPGYGPQISISDYVDGYENPMAWHKKFVVRCDEKKKDVLFDNMDMRDMNLAQYGSEQPENIKWRLFGYNLVICYEYISKGNPDKALEVIGDIENILLSIGSNDPFLKSILIALNHITFSMKGYLMKLCAMDTLNLEHIVMPNDMNHVHKAGLYGVQILFFYEYGIPCVQIMKDSAFKALSLNKDEAEWHFLVSRVLTRWQRTCGNISECSDEEINAAKTAVNMSGKDHYKLHLVQIYYRMSRNLKSNTDFKNKLLNDGLKLISEVMINTNDLISLKNCLLSMSKIALDKHNNDLNEILEKLVNKLTSSDNGYVHGAIGNYYLFNKKDYEKANFHLKKAFDIKSFGSSIDYIYTFYKMNPETAPIEEMLVDMLKTFSHPVQREKIISQIISYLIITKNDLIQALKYVPMLLKITNLICIHSLQAHRVKYGRHNKPINLLDVIAEELIIALNDPTIPTDHIKRIREVKQMLESYKANLSSIIKTKENIVRKKEFNTKNDGSYNNNKESWTYKNEKNTEEGNWRTLKPDPNPNTEVFSRGFHKRVSNNGMEIKTRFIPKK